MKWKKYTIETTTAAEDFMSSMLMDLDIEGIEIEDNIPLTKEDQADMFIDFLPELPPDEGISHEVTVKHFGNTASMGKRIDHSRSVLSPEEEENSRKVIAKELDIDEDLLK